MQACLSLHDYDKRFALHLAASEGHLDVVKWLVENGCDVNVKDRWGGTPLQDAIRGKFAAVADFLISSGGVLDAAVARAALEEKPAARRPRL